MVLMDVRMGGVNGVDEIRLRVSQRADHRLSVDPLLALVGPFLGGSQDFPSRFGLRDEITESSADLIQRHLPGVIFGEPRLAGSSQNVERRLHGLLVLGREGHFSNRPIIVRAST